MSKYIGDVSAYAYAVSKGYTGTEEEFAELMASYATVGQTAVDAKDAAVAAKTAAQAAATTATNKASEATTAAQTATTKAGEASTSASTATSAKDTAVSASQTATSKATEATTAAATATSAASTATTAKDDAVSAKTAAQTAQTGAETARDAVQSSAAQIATNASDITQLKEDLNDTKAVTVKEQQSSTQITEPVLATFTDGYITNTGVVTQSTTYHYTEKLAVKEGDIFFTSGVNIRFVTAYDGNSVVSDKGVSSVTNTYTVPRGISHIVLSLRAVATTITKTYYKKVLVNALDGLLDIKDVLVFTSLNRFDVSAISENTILNSSGNGTSANSANNTSDYIYVGDLDSVKIYRNSTPVLYNAYYVLYDADKNPIDSRAVGKAISLSDQATYIRISYNNAETNIQVCDGSKTISWYSAYETPTADRDSKRIKTLESEDETLWNSNVLYGKKWVSCGDSFTGGAFQDVSEPSEKYIMSGKYLGKNKVYPYIIGNRNNMDIVNEAVSGSTMCLNDGTHNAFSTANGRYTQIPEDADYITLYFGINDVNYNSPMGEITDNTNTTFYGAWNVVLEYLITNHPFAKIGIIVTNGASQAIREAEIAIAKRWGIAYYDMNGLPLMHRSFNQDVLTSVKNFRNDKFRVSASNGHPNGKAHEYQSTAIEAWLRSL